MVFVLAGFIALGTWLTFQDDLWDRQSSAFEATTVNVKVYAPIEQYRICRKIEDGPVFRDLESSSS